MTANNTDLPPLPKMGATGPQVCATIRLYLAVLNDLPPEQVQIVSAHIQTCANCTREQRLLDRVTQLAARLPASAPSARVDQAIMAAIAVQSNGSVPERPRPIPVSRKHRANWLIGQVVAAAVLLLALLGAVHFMMSSLTPSQAFALPANLTWSGYVLYHSETKIDANGRRYHINSYHDLGTDRVNVETTMPGSLDVIAVGSDHTMLGMDMMHHVAQWGAEAWGVDDSMFNLEELRSDMQAKRAIYLDHDRFRGQDVYRIRARNGLVLLLNMQYRPVNVLRGAVGPGTGEPMYDTLKLLLTSQVPSSMWDMSIPAGFQMGTLPPEL